MLDIAFVIDSSGSINDTNVGGDQPGGWVNVNWNYVIDFMVRLVGSNVINIGPDVTHVGAVSFGT